MNATPHTCTVGPDAIHGERCGKPAVTSFVGYDGTEYHECAEHAVAVIGRRTRESAQVGDVVTVNRHGKQYTGTVKRVTRTGRVFVRVRYDNGVVRVVEATR
jgi:hypothetical protein